MKALTILGGILLCIISFQLPAQTTAPINQKLAVKSPLFSRLPQKFPVSTHALEKIFNTTPSSLLKISVSNAISFEGVILEKVQRTPRIQSINIKLQNYDGALMTISKMIDENGEVSYSGRLFNIKYGDALIFKTENNQVYLSREDQSVFLVE